ncbi:MAG TPA: hypothetical protein VFY93_06220 [Planctomycetota bacterium]|nr:hypothetical protein [Planctomycetota bacterium]
MRTRWLLPLLTAACGGPDPVSKSGLDLTTLDGVTDAHIRTMDEMADVVDGIEDMKTAEAARPRMEEIGKRFREINAAEESLPPPTPDERRRNDAKLDEAAKRLEPLFARTMDRLDLETRGLVARMMAAATFGDRR